MAIDTITITDANGVAWKVLVDNDGSNNYTQVEKIGFSADDAAPVLVSSSNPLPTTNALGATAAKQDLAKAVLDAIATSTAGTAALLSGVLTVVLQDAGDVANTLTNGRKTIAATGTPEALRGSSLGARWVMVTALKTNTEDVYVGGAGIVADAGSQTGVPLEPGASVTIPVDDVATVFVDVLVNGEGVTWLRGA